MLAFSIYDEKWRSYSGKNCFTTVALPGAGDARRQYNLFSIIIKVKYQ